MLGNCYRRRVERQNKLNQYKKQLDDHMKKPKNSESLDSIAESVQSLFEEVTQLDNESPKFKA